MHCGQNTEFLNVKTNDKYMTYVLGFDTLKLSVNAIKPLNAELNPICHLLALLGGATIVVVSRLRVKVCCGEKSCRSIHS